MDENLKTRIAEMVIAELTQRGVRIEKSAFRVPVAISARHVHLSEEDLYLLFGTGYELSVHRDISQPGQYAAQETVTIEGNKGNLENVRVVGPVRAETQVEISRTDAFALGMDVPVKPSGNLAGTPGIRIRGPKGVLELAKGIIVADRHIHMTPRDAAQFGCSDGEKVHVRVGGVKPGILGGVIIRVSPASSLELHLDTDDANAFFLNNGDLLEVIKKENF